MRNDPYYWTQDNGAGAPVHFAVTYRQIDMLHHILRNCPVAINQRDPRGFTPLHRAAYLAQYDGYLEIYEYLLSRARTPPSAPTISTPTSTPAPSSPSTSPSKTTPPATPSEPSRRSTRASRRSPSPARDIGDWWALYDHGPETVYGWPKEHKPEYPERRRGREAREGETRV